MKPVAIKYLLNNHSDYEFINPSKLLRVADDYVFNFIEYWNNEDMKILIKVFDEFSDDVYPEHCQFRYLLTSKSSKNRYYLAYIDNVKTPYVRISKNNPIPFCVDEFGNFTEKRILKNRETRRSPLCPIVGYGFPAFLATNAKLFEGDVWNNIDSLIIDYTKSIYSLFMFLYNEHGDYRLSSYSSYFDVLNYTKEGGKLDYIFFNYMLKNERKNRKKSIKLRVLYCGLLDEYIDYYIQYLKDNVKRLSLFIK